MINTATTRKAGETTETRRMTRMRTTRTNKPKMIIWADEEENQDHEDEEGKEDFEEEEHGEDVGREGEDARRDYVSASG